LTFIFPESEQSPLHGRRCCHRVFTVLCGGTWLKCIK
jgi:hypothetical protein